MSFLKQDAKEINAGRQNLASVSIPAFSRAYPCSI